MLIQAGKLTARSMEAVVDIIGRATSWVALLIIVLMTGNVLLRYSFNYGSVWAQELEWHLMGVLVLFGMSYALLKDGAVRVDLFYAHYAAGTKRLVDFFSLLLQFAIGCVILWLSLNYVEQSYSINEVSADPGGLPFRWAIKSLLPIGFGLLLLQSLAAMLRLWLVRPESSEATHA